MVGTSGRGPRRPLAEVSSPYLGRDFIPARERFRELGRGAIFVRTKAKASEAIVQHVIDKVMLFVPLDATAANSQTPHSDNPTTRRNDHGQ
jgi:hypothetical protein